MNFDDLSVKPDSRVNLAKTSTLPEAGITKEEALARTEKNLQRITRLQEALYAEHEQSLLIVLQAMDTGGKDGTVRTIAGAMNPAGVGVTSFKTPSKEEDDHDFLWRIHDKTPKKGHISVFNRSHYEDVLYVRVHETVPEKTWKNRYEQINDFEKHLTQNGTHILKFFLHISKDEQFERLRERIENPAKNWKFSEADLAEREYWDDYQAAYEDALSKCSTKHAPWHIVPADKKWYRNLVISEVVADHLESLKIKTPEPHFDVEEIKRKYFSKPTNGKVSAQFNPK